MTILVVIDVKRMVYSRYEDRKLTHRFDHHTLLSPYWVEEIRRDPDQFQNENKAPKP
jgi:hypothetical protein